MAFQQLPYAIRKGPNWDALNQSLGGATDAYAQQQQRQNDLKQQVQLYLFQKQLEQKFSQEKFQQDLQNQNAALDQNVQNYQKYAGLLNGGGQQGGGFQMPQQPQQAPPSSLQQVIGQMPQGQQPAMSMTNGGVGTAAGQPFDLASALAKAQQGQQAPQQMQGMQQGRQGQQGQFILNPNSAFTGKFNMMKNPAYKNTQESSISGLDVSQLKQAKTPEERQSLLDQLPPELAKNVQQAGEYNLDANKIYGLRNNSGDRAKFDALVGMAYPGFDMKKYPQQQAYMNDLAKGKLNQQVMALNTVRKHLDTFDQSIDKLNNGNFSPKNAIINAAKELSGDPGITDLKLAQSVVQSEMERLLTSVGVTQQGLAHVRTILSPNSGYKQMKDNVALLKTIINGRLQPLRTQFKNIMGRDENGEILFPNSSTYDSGGQQGSQQGQGGGQDYSSMWN